MFSDALVNGVPLVVVIMGLVEFAKKLGLQGKALIVLSMMLGIAFGVAYQVSISGVAGDFSTWFGYVVYGLALGLTASGIYDLIDARWPKAEG